VYVALSLYKRYLASHTRRKHGKNILWYYQ